MVKIAVVGLLVSLVVSLNACSTSQFKHARYPTKLEGIKDTPSQPLKAAGFKRGAITLYSPGMTDISTEYKINTPENQIASTLYVYEFPTELNELFKKEKANIVRANGDAELIDETEVKLVKNGVEYKALQSTFKFDTNFSNKQQAVFSQFVLWKHNNKYYKLRSTSPLSQKDQTLKKNNELIDAIEWAD